MRLIPAASSRFFVHGRWRTRRQRRRHRRRWLRCRARRIVAAGRALQRCHFCASHAPCCFPPLAGPHSSCAWSQRLVDGGNSSSGFRRARIRAGLGTVPRAMWLRFASARVSCAACRVRPAPRAVRRGVYYTPQTPLGVVLMLDRSCYGTVDVFDARGPRVTVFRVRYYVRTKSGRESQTSY